MCVCIAGTSSVSNMVRLDENGELFFSRISHGFSKDMEPNPISRRTPPTTASVLASPLTRNEILQREGGEEREREGERGRESEEEG